MRSIIVTLSLCLSLLGPGLAHPGAGPGHRHEKPVAISETKAEVRAVKFLQSKVEKGKLSESWLDKKPSKTYQKSFGYGPEWVVEFEDPKNVDVKKRTLYVFMSTTGKLLGVNFTGH